MAEGEPKRSVSRRTLTGPTWGSMFRTMAASVSVMGMEQWAEGV
jgi:hypothetical protein